MLSEKARTNILDLMQRYPDKRSAIMPALDLAQRECQWLSDELLLELSALTGLSTTEINSVATFYTMYARERRGTHTLYFCTDLPCALRGADELMEHIEHRLGCRAGETSPDGKVTLRDAECLGGCDHAPVALVDGIEHIEDLTKEKADQLIERLTKG